MCIGGLNLGQGLANFRPQRDKTPGPAACPTANTQDLGTVRVGVPVHGTGVSWGDAARPATHDIQAL